MSTVTRRAKFGAALSLVAVLTAFGLLYVQAVAGSDARFRACGGSAGHVRAAFALNHARDIQSHYPHLLRTPELETDSPAFVVDFDGDTAIPLMTVNPRAPQITSFKNVMCVFADGAPNWYFDVDKTDMHP